MDGNYEAQSHFTRERLAARREQAAAERLLRLERPARATVLRQLLMRLFRRSVRRDEKRSVQQTRPVVLAKKGKGKFA